MTQIKTHTPSKSFFDELIGNGYKSFTLLDSDGNKIIPYNKPEVTPLAKSKEILTRFKTLPEGNYQLIAQYSFSRTTKPDLFYLTKGNAPVTMSEPMPMPMKPTKKEKEVENVMSIETALSNIKENAVLTAENAVLKEKVKQLEIRVSELESELESEPEMSEGEQQPDKVGHWLNTIMPVLSPLADQYFQTKNRQLDIEQQKLVQKYQAPARPQIVRKSKKTMQQSNYPDINNETEVNQYMDYLEQLSDPDFEQVLFAMSQEHPQLYDMVCAEFFPEDEPEEQQETPTE